MRELKREVHKILNQLNKKWIDALEEQNKSNSKNLNLSNILGEYSLLVDDLDLAFYNYENKKKNKKLFGGLFKNDKHRKDKSFN